MYKTNKILITIGDVSGIGPEIALKSILKNEILKNESKQKKFLPILIGNIEVLKKTLKICDKKNENNIFKNDILFNELNENHSNIICDKNVINVVNIKFEQNYDFRFGKPDEITGKYSYLYLQKAVEILQNPEFIKNGYKRLITAPISKKHWELANIQYQAHTEALAGLTNTKKFAMIFANSKAIVILATRHIPISTMSKYFTKNALEDAIDIGIDFLKQLKKNNPNIGVCGLNPHAGENGYSGKEEQNIIIPILNLEKYKNIKFTGPVSGDSLFQKMTDKKIDLIISAYHDQGIFPLKAMDYYGCVNISFGLPFIRVSPGHGTAFDIAGKGIANEKSFSEAIKWSLKINL
jgi:4-hydroxythreonine-4-phosphate dehydrogenase